MRRGAGEPALKRKRGGCNQQAQRLAQAKEDEQPTEPSVLFLFLLHSWTWGLLTSHLVQQVAQLVMEDLEKHKRGALDTRHLQSMAKLGSNGQQAGKIHGELLQYANSIDHPAFPKPGYVQLPLKDKGMPGYKMMEQGIYWPHEVFAWLYHESRDFFLQNICPSTEVVQHFWRSMRGHPMLESHPMKAKTERGKEWFRRCVPLSVHGDGVPITGVGKSWAKSMDIWSWKSCLVSTSTLLSNFLIIGLYSALLSKVPGAETEEAFYVSLAWSFLWLYRGRWPDEDYLKGTDFIDVSKAGMPLADDFFAVIWNIRCDLDFKANSLKLPHYASNEPCNFCACNCFEGPAAVPWNDFRVGIARWMDMIYSSAQWYALFPNHNPLLDLPGVTHHAVTCDTMHCKHMGTDMWFLGSVLHYLCYHLLDGTGRLANVLFDYIYIYVASCNFKTQSNLNCENIQGFEGHIKQQTDME